MAKNLPVSRELRERCSLCIDTLVSALDSITEQLAFFPTLDFSSNMETLRTYCDLVSSVADGKKKALSPEDRAALKDSDGTIGNALNIQLDLMAEGISEQQGDARHRIVPAISTFSVSVSNVRTKVNKLETHAGTATAAAGK